MFKKISKKTSLEPLEAIKRLLILDLLKKGKGATSEEIGKVLDVDPSTIRHLIPSRKSKKE